MRARNLRKYGSRPFSVAVVHGGPGAAGEMAPVARKLAADHGVLEPLQTKSTVTGQIDELRDALLESARLPVTLIGFSWGAWLSFILAAAYPELVKKLILVSSGSFEERFGKRTQAVRMSRLSAGQRIEIRSLEKTLNDKKGKDKEVIFARLGALFARVDNYNPLTDSREELALDPGIFRGVWKDADRLRKSGKLLELGRHIQCPVVAIHGDYDPHPAEGVQKPLLRVLKKFRFILIPDCGHKPWIERGARRRFFEILNEELV